MELSIDWKVGATTIIIINSTRKISVNGVIFISVKALFFLPDELNAILLSLFNYIEALDADLTSVSESTKLKNNSLINWKSSSYRLTIDWKEL
jgi:hypothetical protein